MTTTTQKIILSHLLYNETYARKVLPFLKEEYFLENSERILFKKLHHYIMKYNTLPSKQALLIDVQNDSSVSENDAKTVFTDIETLTESETDISWLLQETEKFCKDKAVYNAIVQSIQIIDGTDKNYQQDAIPTILQQALGVGFDHHVGHDYLDNAEQRFEYYHRKEMKVPFDLEYFNKITDGGLPNKTLNIALAGTGVGKSLFMCHVAASHLAKGFNVLYITLEMSEERIAERIDANLMDINIGELRTLPKTRFDYRIDRIRKGTEGKLVIKEYPTAAAHAGHFKTLLSELALKRNFVPQIIFVDYLNICSSSRFKPSSNVNSYTYIKAIAEELRGLAVEQNVPIVSATQTTRGGYDNSDVEITDTSESFGLPATADFMFALIATEELDQLNQIMIKQLKNRYNDPSVNKRFMLGIDRGKMKLFDLAPSEQQNISDANITHTSHDDEDDSVFTKRDFSKTHRIHI